MQEILLISSVQCWLITVLYLLHIYLHNAYYNVLLSTMFHNYMKFLINIYEDEMKTKFFVISMLIKNNSLNKYLLVARHDFMKLPRHLYILP